MVSSTFLLSADKIIYQQEKSPQSLSRTRGEEGAEDFWHSLPKIQNLSKKDFAGFAIELSVSFNGSVMGRS